jgi:hypothetical protein
MNAVPATSKTKAAKAAFFFQFEAPGGAHIPLAKLL